MVKTSFAKVAGVSDAAVSKATRRALRPALVGKRIDADHPAAVEYVERQKRRREPSPAPGIDPLFPRAVAACRVANCMTVAYLKTALGIGQPRAQRIISQMKAAEVTPSDPPPPPPPVAVEPPPPVVVEPPPPVAVEPPADILIDVPADIQAFADMTLRELIEKFGTVSHFNDWLKATNEIEKINERRLKNAATEGVLVSRELIKSGVIDPFNAAHRRMLTDGAKTIAVRVDAMSRAGRSVADIEAFVSDQIGSFIRPVKACVARALRNA